MNRLKHPSWAPEVKTGIGPTWTGNGLRFATKEEAYGNVRALRSKWRAVREIRVVRTEDPVNARWFGGKTVRIPQPKRPEIDEDDATVDTH